MPAIFKRTNRSIVCLCTILSVLQISACSSSSAGTTDVGTQSSIDSQSSNQGGVQGYNQTYDQTYGQDNGQGYTQVNGQDGDQYQRNPSSALPPQERILFVRNKLLTWHAPVSREDDTPLLISDIAGYRIYYGGKRKDYQEMIEVRTSASNRFDFSEFPRGVYYMVLTAVDIDGRESLYSRELLLINFG